MIVDVSDVCALNARSLNGDADHVPVFLAGAWYHREGSSYGFQQAKVYASSRTRGGGGTVVLPETSAPEEAPRQPVVGSASAVC